MDIYLQLINFWSRFNSTWQLINFRVEEKKTMIYGIFQILSNKQCF